MNVQYKCDIDFLDLLQKKEDIPIPYKDDKEYKIRIEENIKLIKEQLYQLFETSFKNKNEIQNIQNTINLVNKINEDLTKITKDIEDYKRINNERIEKIFKLLINISNTQKS